ncbi:MAG: glycosyltransferase [SAR324 cluster bacterium]|nr:glycosyltransferase [SAR324 cluster bacterium]
MKNSLISIILPTLNEAGNIEEMISSVSDQFQGDDQFEILVVDDGSTDGTIEIVDAIQEKSPNVRLIVRTSDFGLINSINDGITQSKGGICIWMDADLSMDPVLITSMIQEIHQGSDLVLGSRYMPGGRMKAGDPSKGKGQLPKILYDLSKSNDSAISAMISIFGNKILKVILGSSIHDYSSGFYATKKEFIIDNLPHGTFVDYCISLPYHAILDGFKVTEVPMVLKARESGESKTSGSFYSILSISLRCVLLGISLRLKHGKM